MWIGLIMAMVVMIIVPVVIFFVVVMIIVPVVILFMVVMIIVTMVVMITVGFKGTTFPEVECGKSMTFHKWNRLRIFGFAFNRLFQKRL